MATLTGLTCYITGASGYLGGDLVRDMVKEGYKRMYVPVRNKKGESGQDRFNKLYSEELRDAGVTWCDPCEPIPADTQVVMLNAFNISFGLDIQSSLLENVAPMLPLLEQCKGLPNLEHVMLVSTAYVQPPNKCDCGKNCPSVKRTHGLIPFGGAKDPTALYQSLIEGKTKWKDLEEDPLNHPHTTENAYVYSKTLLEHMVMQKYGKDLPITLFRPSIISCSSDGEHGSRFTPPCGLAQVFRSAGGRLFYKAETNVDFVFVDYVSKLAIKTLSKPFVWKKEGATVVMATGSSNTTKWQFIHETKYEGKTMYYPASRTVFNVLRFLEILCYRVFIGAKMARIMTIVYDNYDHFCQHEWDFEPNCHSEADHMCAMLKKWTDNNPPPALKNPLTQLKDAVLPYLSLLRFGHHQNYLVVIVSCLCFPGAQLSAWTVVELLKLYFSFNMCLYGALYTINGITDAQEDADHPEKKYRPCAKALWAPGSPGSISHQTAWTYVGCLIATGFATAYMWWGMRMIPMYAFFIVLNLTYSYGMRNVKYCRFPTAALTAPCRLHMGCLLTGGQPCIAVYVIMYFFMIGIQSSKIRIEKYAMKNVEINGWSAGTVEAVTAVGMLAGMAVYAMSEDPLKWVFLGIVGTAHFTYNVAPYFSKGMEKNLRKLYTIDCHKVDAPAKAEKAQ
jgi:nucleoside-diphosphate-sugar epimerase